MTKPWEEHRDEITHLYISEGMTLDTVRTVMRHRHKFDASVRSYRQHFDDWGIGKYNCKKRRRDSTGKSIRQTRRREQLRPILSSASSTMSIVPALSTITPKAGNVDTDRTSPDVLSGSCQDEWAELRIRPVESQYLTPTSYSQQCHAYSPPTPRYQRHHYSATFPPRFPFHDTHQRQDSTTTMVGNSDVWLKQEGSSDVWLKQEQEYHPSLCQVEDALRYRVSSSSPLCSINDTVPPFCDRPLAYHGQSQNQNSQDNPDSVGTWPDSSRLGASIFSRLPHVSQIAVEM